MDLVMERDRIQYLDDGWNVLAEVTFAGQLMHRAVASIAASGYYARPTCSYAVSWFEKHPEHAALLA